MARVKRGVTKRKHRKKVLEAASVPDGQDLYEAQRSVFLDPNDPEVIREAEKAGIARDWIEAAQRSPIHALINTYKGGVAAAPGVPHDADGLVHPTAVPSHRRRQGHR